MPVRAKLSLLLLIHVESRNFAQLQVDNLRFQRGNDKKTSMYVFKTESYRSKIMHFKDEKLDLVL